MYRSLAASASPVSLPEEKYRIYYQDKLAEEELTEFDGEDVVKPSREKVLKKITVDEDTFLQVQRVAHIYSIDNRNKNSDDSVSDKQIKDIINRPHDVDDISYGRVNRMRISYKNAPQELGLLDKESIEEIKSLIDNLAEKNRKANTMRFGFDDDEPKSNEKLLRSLTLTR